MLVVQALPQLPQLLELLEVSMHVPVQSVGVAAGQPDAQLCPPSVSAHKGVAALQDTMQPPQCEVCVRSVSQPSAGLPLQSARLGAQEEGGNEHWPAVQVTAPLTKGRFVQSLPQAPQ